MTYRVFDDKFENSTTLIIQVLDVNDNPPRFDNAVYNVLDLNEEEPGISKSSPKYLLTVTSIFLCILYFLCVILFSCANVLTVWMLMTVSLSITFSNSHVDKLCS